MIRKTKPETIIEVGSGFSTLVAREALSVNGKGRLICVEPFPRPWLRGMTDVELIEAPAQALEAGFYNDRLMDGDMRLIDSTHSVKIGSDCLHFYLRVLPRIDYSIDVHVHDVFLPCGLPKNRAIDNHIYWTEQYLLLAYLIVELTLRFRLWFPFGAEEVAEAVERVCARPLSRWRGIVLDVSGGAEGEGEDLSIIT